MLWLLNVDSISLVPFQDDRQAKGKYAILSHTWGKEEVSFQEISRPESRQKQGYKKIEWVCTKAKEQDLKFAWVDTCCIDKTSSAELSQAIDSMYRWYSDSAVCLVYLEDVPASLAGFRKRLFRPDPSKSAVYLLPTESSAKSLPALRSAASRDGDGWSVFIEHLSKCRWFSRGWTLQELVAPRQLRLYNARHNELIGSKDDLTNVLSKITRVPVRVLQDNSSLMLEPVAKRLSWAAHRDTTREEDMAYCLLGIVGVNIPLLYGEDPRAFQRLQEEIIRQSTDTSLFTWTPWTREQNELLFSSTPYGFRSGYMIESMTHKVHQGFQLTNAGLQISLPVEQVKDHLIAHLNCSTSSGYVFIRLLSHRDMKTLDESTTVCVAIREDVPYPDDLEPWLWPTKPLSIFKSCGALPPAIVHISIPKLAGTWRLEALGSDGLLKDKDFDILLTQKRPWDMLLCEGYNGAAQTLVFHVSLSPSPSWSKLQVAWYEKDDFKRFLRQEESPIHGTVAAPEASTKIWTFRCRATATYAGEYNPERHAPPSGLRTYAGIWKGAMFNLRVSLTHWMTFVEERSPGPCGPPLPRTQSSAEAGGLHLQESTRDLQFCFLFSNTAIGKLVPEHRMSEMGRCSSMGDLPHRTSMRGTEV